MDQDLDTTMATEEEPKNNTRTIIIVVAVVLLCCCCGFIAAAWFLGDYIVDFIKELFQDYTFEILKIVA